MRRALIPSLIAGALAVPALLLPSQGAQAASTVQLVRNVLPGITQLTGGTADPSQVLSIGVALQRPDPAGEDALFKALYDPASPQFHHFPTIAQLDARFGVPQARVSLVTTMLKRAGVTVDSVSSGGEYISAHGPVAKLEKAFSLSIKSFTAGPYSFVANTAGPLVPSAAGITTIVGLNTLQRFTTAGTARPAQDTCLVGPCMGLTTPQDLWSLYGQPSNQTGKNVAIAIIGEGNPKNILADLPKQRAKYGLPTATVTVTCVQGGDCGTDTGGDGEWDIDTQASLGMAPDATEQLYFAKTIYDGDLNSSFVAWAEDPKGPIVASASLGECEAGPANGLLTSGPLGDINGNLNGNLLGGGLALGNGEAAAVDPELKKAAMAGKTLFASTGDTGSSCPVVYLPVVGGGNGVLNQALPEQSYPAVSPYVVAVGGTVPYTNDNGEGAGDSYAPGKPAATRASEISWTEGGGGASLFVPEPSWQAPVANIFHPCVIGADGSIGATGQTCRGVPDVAAQSGDIVTNGYSIYSGGGFSQGAGTSLSSPLWAGMWARVVGASAQPLGLATPLIYQHATVAADYAKMFLDITLGANGLYTAGPGWDYNTGWGVPNVSGLIDVLAIKGSTIKQSTKDLTIRRDKTAVRFGNKLTLSGRLTADNVALPRVTLTLKGKTNDKKVVTIATIVTDPYGAWSYTFKPKRDEVYSISGSGLTSALAKTPTTLSFPQLKGVARAGVLSVSGSIGPGYKLSSSQTETVSVYRLSADGKKKITLLGTVKALQETKRKGVYVNRFSLVTAVPKGNYKVGIAVSSMPLNAGAIAAVFTVKV